MFLGAAVCDGAICCLQSNPGHAAFVEGRIVQEKNVLEIICSGEMQSLRIFCWKLLVN